MNDVEFSRLETILHIGTKKYKESMMTLDFQKYIGGTEVCMKRLTIATKMCVQMTSNNTNFADSSFSGVKTADEGMAVGNNYLIKYCSVGPYLANNSIPIFPGGITLVNIGYKYNPRKVLGLIATDGSGSTELDYLYLSGFPEIYFNISINPVVCPNFISRHFNAYNAIGDHNSMHHSDLVIDKYRVTQSGYIRLITKVLFGMGITDARHCITRWLR